MTWLKNTDCTELNITKYKSISEVASIAEITIKDKAAVTSFMNQINALPPHDDLMVKPAPSAQLIRLVFNCSDKSQQVIEILNKRFKTPSSGFITERNSQEESIYQDIDALLLPDLHKKILKIKDQPIKFKDFTITYTGEHRRESPKDGPTIGPTNNVFFSIQVPGSANKTVLSIFEGQTPPQPQKFIVGKKEYILLTYANAKKERLYPKYFMVTDKLPKKVKKSNLF